MRDDEFDRQRARPDLAFDVGIDPLRTPGKQTLVEAESGPSRQLPSAPGKRTLVDLSTWTQGVGQGSDAIVETEFHVRKARETMAKLAADVPPTERRILQADLRSHVNNAKTVGARAFAMPDGRAVAESMLTLIAEAEPLLAKLADVGASSAADPVAIARRGVDGPGERLPHLDEVQRLLGGFDLSGVRAHIGGAAAAASRELGAHAYAHGNDVAFAEYPSAPTVAHEVTHIAQQRAGVSLKSIDGGSSDAHEQQADAVEQRVARGQSAADLIAGIRGGGGASSSPAVQRKSGGANAAASAPLSGPFDIGADGMSARVQSKWVGDDPARWLEVLHAMQAKGAVPWATDASLGRLAKILVQRNLHTVEVIPFRLDATAIAIIGLPPNAKPLVEDYGDGVQIAIEGLAGPQLDFELVLAEQGGEEHAKLFRAVYASLEKHSRLHAVQRPTLYPRAASPTTALLRLSSTELGAIFGPEAWRSYLSRSRKHEDQAANGAATTAPASVAPQPQAAIAPADAERVGAWFAKNHAKAPHNVDHSVVVIIDEIESKPELASAVRQLLKQSGGPQRELDAVALRDLVARARVEVERSRLGLGAFSIEHGLGVMAKNPRRVEAFDDAALQARILEHGLVLSGRPTRLEVALDWSAYRNTHDASFSERDWRVVVDWVFERTDIQGPTPKNGAPVAQAEHVQGGTINEHTFKLGPQEQSGTWTVHAFIYTSHFAPRHITAPIQVKTENARMADLRGEAFAGMQPANAKTSPHRFSLGVANAVVSPMHLDGYDPDADGTMTTGDLPATFQARSPDERAATRQDEIHRSEQLVEYLQHLGDPRYGDALAAAKRRLEQLRSIDKDIKSDESSGWQSFEVRGTYLCRRPEVPSGPLDLYGTVRRDAVAHVGQFVRVQLRDHSQRIGTDTPTFQGIGSTFEQALEAAVVDLAKEYPEGKVSILAQAMDASGASAKPTQKAIGFELPTTSSWKRFKDKVYNPTVQTIVNAAATALMVFQPELAPVVLSILTVSNTVRNVDELIHLKDTGNLTWKSSRLTLAQIGLDVLPFVRGAKIFSSPGRLVAMEAVNHAGMLIVMGMQTREAIAQIQENDIAALAETYRELLEMQRNTNASDPALDPQLQQRIAAKKREVDEGAEKIRNRVQEQWTAAIGQQGIFMIGSHILGDVQRTRVAGAVGTGVDPNAAAHVTNGGDASGVAEHVGASHAATEPEPSTGQTSAAEQGGTKPQQVASAPSHQAASHGAEGTSAKDEAVHYSSASERSHAADSTTGGAPPPEAVVGSPNVDADNDAARIQTKSINAAIEAGETGLDWNKRNRAGTTTLGAEYKRWIESADPVDFSGKQPKAKYHGDPDFKDDIDAIVAKGNVTLNLRAQANAEAALKLKLKSLDPASPTYAAARSKLVDKFGGEAVARYERAVLGDASDPTRQQIYEQVDKIVGPDAFAELRNAYPDCEIYITGSASQPSKGKPADIAKIVDLDVVLVVPEGMDGAGRAALEARAKSLRVPTTPEFAQATGRSSLPLDATARTKAQAFGLMTTPTPTDATGRPRTPLEYARIDTHVSERAAAAREYTQVRQWADNLAESNPNKMTEAQRADDLAGYKSRKQEVASMLHDRPVRAVERNGEWYVESESGKLRGPYPPNPGKNMTAKQVAESTVLQGVPQDRLELAVEGDPSTGERVPLTYGTNTEQAKQLYHQFQADLKAVFESEGITDAKVVQLGSGTSGWSTAPAKTGKAWTPKSDVDFAIFSNQALEQAMKAGVPINPKNQQGGKYTTLKNSAAGKGFYEATSLGKKLANLASEWNERVYGTEQVDGFDFKLNLSDVPFQSAVPVLDEAEDSTAAKPTGDR